MLDWMRKARKHCGGYANRPDGRTPKSFAAASGCSLGWPRPMGEGVKSSASASSPLVYPTSGRTRIISRDLVAREADLTRYRCDCRNAGQERAPSSGMLREAFRSDRGADNDRARNCGSLLPTPRPPGCSRNRTVQCRRGDLSNPTPVSRRCGPH